MFLLCSACLTKYFYREYWYWPIVERDANPDENASVVQGEIIQEAMQADLWWWEDQEEQSSQALREDGQAPDQSWQQAGHVQQVSTVQGKSVLCRRKRIQANLLDYILF